MKGKKKAREVQPKAVTCWMTKRLREVYPQLGVWWTESDCRGYIKEHGYDWLRPIKVRIVPVLPKKRGALLAWRGQARNWAEAQWRAVR